MSVNKHFTDAIYTLLEQWENELQEMTAGSNKLMTNGAGEAADAQYTELQLRIDKLRKFIEQHASPAKD